MLFPRGCCPFGQNSSVSQPPVGALQSSAAVGASMAGHPVFGGGTAPFPSAQGFPGQHRFGTPLANPLQIETCDPNATDDVLPLAWWFQYIDRSPEEVRWEFSRRPRQEWPNLEDSLRDRAQTLYRDTLKSVPATCRTDPIIEKKHSFVVHPATPTTTAPIQRAQVGTVSVTGGSAGCAGGGTEADFHKAQFEVG
eukprot:GHVN01057373.1.p1 GENE.GHVN01057373.1~~GHVN01057373.1.p1  ORF type:complete len:195 (+),score=19.94 GHVN01057373.1:919-1503(+)